MKNQKIPFNQSKLLILKNFSNFAITTVLNCNKTMKITFFLTIILSFLTFGCQKSSTPSSFYPTHFNIKVPKQIPNDHKIDMFWQEISKDSTLSYQGRIERRGGMSIGYPKHSYEIDLYQDMPLAGLPKDDDWILNANFIDKTFMRHALAYDLFRAMNRNNVAAFYQYVELSLNGKYNGLYVLMEKLDKSTLGINKKDTSAVIFKEPPIFRIKKGFKPQKKGNYHQQTFPKIKHRDKSAFIEDVQDFIINSSDEVFKKQFPTIFDIENIVDWNLLLLLTNNSDGILKNFYLYKKDAKTPLRVAPWDYDHSFGRDGDNELNMIKPLDLNRSNLFQRLLKMNWYQTRLKARWRELNALDILSTNGLKARIARQKNRIDTLVTKNFQRWPVGGKPYYDDNNFEAEIQVMCDFLAMRAEQLEMFFEDF